VRRDGVWDRALAAAVLAALGDVLLDRVLLAALAALAPVCLEFFVMLYSIHVVLRSPGRDL